MEIIKYASRKDWGKLLKRPSLDSRNLDDLVRAVITDIREKGDAGLREYTLRFDKATITDFALSNQEITEAVSETPQLLKDSIDLAIHNITAFHLAQKPKEIRVEITSGIECWQKPVPISKVGLYIPGGMAPLFSTILMLAIPAKIAGCEEIILCTPPDSAGKLNKAIIYAAYKVGVTKVFKVGGAQAIAAMAYGTESIPKVYKIFGPGNQYVTAAKQLVSRDAVAIDMPAGPSEVAVLADNTSNPGFVASDLLSQAEHGTDSQVILIATDEQIIQKVIVELNKQLEELPKKNIAKESLKNSKIFLVESYNEMIEMVNTYAPEHLIISTANADELADKVVNAGSVFIGEYTPESAGDYASGTNHTLPTNGWATAYSGVNLDAFYKKITYQKITKEGLEKIGPAIEEMAAAEELIAHKRAVSIRLQKS